MVQFCFVNQTVSEDDSQEAGKVEPKKGLHIALKGFVYFQPSVRLELQVRECVEITLEMKRAFVTAEVWKK